MCRCRQAIGLVLLVDPSMCSSIIVIIFSIKVLSDYKLSSSCISNMCVLGILELSDSNRAHVTICFMKK